MTCRPPHIYAHAYYTTAKRRKKRRHVVGRGGSDVCRGAYLMAAFIAVAKRYIFSRALSERACTLYVHSTKVQIDTTHVVRLKYTKGIIMTTVLPVYLYIYIYYIGTGACLCILYTYIYIYVSKIYKQQLYVYTHNAWALTGGKRYCSSSSTRISAYQPYNYNIIIPPLYTVCLF